VLVQPEFLAGVPLLGSLVTTGAGAGSLVCEEGGCEDIADVVAADLSSQSVDDAIAKVTATRGGALPVELGNLGEGGAVSQLVNDFGVQPEEIALRESLPLGERTVRPDIVVEDSASGFRGILESKWGYLRWGDSRVVQQAQDYAQLALNKGLPLYYKLYAGADPRFLALLVRLGVQFL